MSVNQVRLGGRIIAKDSLRFTPAGTPVINFRLEHVSEQQEAGGARQVQCEVQCVAIGDAALLSQALEVGQSAEISGFLARRSRNSTQLVLHVHQLKK